MFSKAFSQTSFLPLKHRSLLQNVISTQLNTQRLWEGKLNDMSIGLAFTLWYKSAFEAGNYYFSTGTCIMCRVFCIYSKSILYINTILSWNHLHRSKYWKVVEYFNRMSLSWRYLKYQSLLYFNEQLSPEPDITTISFFNDANIFRSTTNGLWT